MDATVPTTLAPRCEAKPSFGWLACLIGIGGEWVRPGRRVRPR